LVSGIFVAPTSVLLHSGSAGLSLCLWGAGAIVSALGALAYVELGSCIPVSGGGFAYQMHAGWLVLYQSSYWLYRMEFCVLGIALPCLSFGSALFSPYQ
jgi:amino acid transporter